ncbi:MAG TPA: hypothetical protein VFZ61_34770 [Polyangiales bacterium]
MPAFLRIVVAVGGSDAKDVTPFLAIPEMRALRHDPERVLDVTLLGGAAADWAIRMAESNGHVVTVVPGQWPATTALARLQGTSDKLYLLPSADADAFEAASSLGFQALRYAPEAGGWRAAD